MRNYKGTRIVLERASGLPDHIIDMIIRELKTIYINASNNIKRHMRGMFARLRYYDALDMITSSSAYGVNNTIIDLDASMPAYLENLKQAFIQWQQRQRLSRRR